uniref:Uncharacterized protein n=1 Tax=Lactuca sativa TaxID=4236 RepID=A0A9R1XK21_LACSA|nr:hypothetical protein LSAT_V11C300137380 [Lactuca sativa]
MASSSETLSIQEHIGKCQLLSIKPHQNLIIDLDTCKYESHFLMIIKCLNYSPLIIALTKMERFRWLPLSDDMINLESMTNAALLEIFYQMGYKETLTAISKFWKPNLPPQWNGVFTLLFNEFFERVTGFNCAHKLFMAIIYGV